MTQDDKAASADSEKRGGEEGRGGSENSEAEMKKKEERATDRFPCVS